MTNTTRRGRGLWLAVLILIGGTAGARASESVDTAAELTRIQGLLDRNEEQEAETAARALAARLEREEGPDSVALSEALVLIVSSRSRPVRGPEPETLETARRAVRIQQSRLPEGDRRLGESLQFLALEFLYSGDFAAAKPLFERALAIREQVLRETESHGTSDSDEVRGAARRAGINCHLLGIVHYQLGESDSSFALVERGIELMKRCCGPDEPRISRMLDVLGTIRLQQERWDESRAYYRRALEMKQARSNPVPTDIAISFNNLGLVADAQNDFEESQSLYERAAATLEQNPTPAYMAVLDNLSNTLRKRGEYSRALRVSRTALELRIRVLGPDHPDVQASRINQSNLLMNAFGDDPGALRLLDLACPALERTLGVDHVRIAVCLGSRAIALESIGDLSRAEQDAERALRITAATIGEETAQYASLLDTLGTVRVKGPNRRQGLADLERTRALYERLFPAGHPSLAGTLSELALAAASDGRLGEARVLLEKAVATLRATVGPDHPEVAGPLVLLAAVQIEQGNRPLAFRTAMEAERIARESFRRTARLMSESEALKLEQTRASGLGEALWLTVEPGGVAPGSGRDVADAVIRSRALMLDESAARNRVAQEEGSEAIAAARRSLDRARAHLARLVADGPDPEKPDTFRPELESALTARDAAERALAESSEEFRIELRQASAGLEDVSRALPSDAALVSFIRYAGPRRFQKGAPIPERYLALVIPPRREASSERTASSSDSGPKRQDIAVVALGEAASLDALVEAWRREAGAAPRPGSTDADSLGRTRAAGVRLRRAVWDPIAPHLAGSRLVLLVPDGALSLVSFAALPDDAGGFLVESAPLLHVLSAERDVLRVEPRAAAPAASLLALGGADFDAITTRQDGPANAGDGSRGGATTGGDGAGDRDLDRGCKSLRSMRFAAIPKSRREAEDVAAVFRTAGVSAENATLLVGAEATEAGFKRLAPGREIVHVATHGFFGAPGCNTVPAGTGEGRPGQAVSSGVSPLLAAGLVFAGANRRPVPAGVEDGLLLAEEAASLDLREARWVVLSGCETGVGTPLAGEGLFGLRRAFEIAGARTLITSLWPVRDEPAREWMKHLYASRLAGRSTAEAVRAASRAVLEARRSSGRSTHPFYWGAFVASGDWR